MTNTMKHYNEQLKRFVFFHGKHTRKEWLLILEDVHPAFRVDILETAKKYFCLVG